MSDVMLLVIVGLLLLNAALVGWLAFRRGDSGTPAAQAHAELLQALQANADRIDRLERELRREMSEAARDGRQESAQNLATFQQTLTQQSAEATRTQNTQIDAFGLQLAGLQKSLSDTLSTQLTGLSESNARRIAELSETSARTLTEVRKTLDAQLIGHLFEACAQACLQRGLELFVHGGPHFVELGGVGALQLRQLGIQGFSHLGQSAGAGFA